MTGARERYGRVVGEVWCGACGDRGRRLARLYRSEGRTTYVSEPPPPPADHVARTKALQRRFSAPELGRVKALSYEQQVLDLAAVDGVPSAWCPRHGPAEIPKERLLSALRQSPSKRAKVIIHYTA